MTHVYNATDIVWAYMEVYPWWPGRIITRSDLVLDPGEPELHLPPNFFLVQFFNPNDERFAIRHPRHLRPFTKVYIHINGGYGGLHAQALHMAFDMALASLPSHRKIPQSCIDNPSPHGSRRPVKQICLLPVETTSVRGSHVRREQLLPPPATRSTHSHSHTSSEPGTTDDDHPNDTPPVVQDSGNISKSGYVFVTKQAAALARNLPDNDNERVVSQDFTVPLPFQRSERDSASSASRSSSDTQRTINEHTHQTTTQNTNTNSPGISKQAAAVLRAWQMHELSDGEPDSDLPLSSTASSMESEASSESISMSDHQHLHTETATESQMNSNNDPTTIMNNTVNQQMHPEPAVISGLNSQDNPIMDTSTTEHQRMHAEPVAPSGAKSPDNPILAKPPSITVARTMQEDDAHQTRQPSHGKLLTQHAELGARRGMYRQDDPMIIRRQSITKAHTRHEKNVLETASQHSDDDPSTEKPGLRPRRTVRDLSTKEAHAFQKNDEQQTSSQPSNDISFIQHAELTEGSGTHRQDVNTAEPITRAQINPGDNGLQTNSQLSDEQLILPRLARRSSSTVAQTRDGNDALEPRVTCQPSAEHPFARHAASSVGRLARRQLATGPNLSRNDDLQANSQLSPEHPFTQRAAPVAQRLTSRPSAIQPPTPLGNNVPQSTSQPSAEIPFSRRITPSAHGLLSRPSGAKAQTLQGNATPYSESQPSKAQSFTRAQETPVAERLARDPLQSTSQLSLGQPSAQHEALVTGRTARRLPIIDVPSIRQDNVQQPTRHPSSVHPFSYHAVWTATNLNRQHPSLTDGQRLDVTDTPQTPSQSSPRQRFNQRTDFDARRSMPTYSSIAETPPTQGSDAVEKPSQSPAEKPTSSLAAWAALRLTRKRPTLTAPETNPGNTAQRNLGPLTSEHSKDQNLGEKAAWLLGRRPATLEPRARRYGVGTQSASQFFGEQPFTQRRTIHKRQKPFFGAHMAAAIAMAQQASERDEQPPLNSGPEQEGARSPVASRNRGITDNGDTARVHRPEAYRSQLPKPTRIAPPLQMRNTYTNSNDDPARQQRHEARRAQWLQSHRPSSYVLERDIEPSIEKARDMGRSPSIANERDVSPTSPDKRGRGDACLPNTSGRENASPPNMAEGENESPPNTPESDDSSPNPYAKLAVPHLRNKPEPPVIPSPPTAPKAAIATENRTSIEQPPPQELCDTQTPHENISRGQTACSPPSDPLAAKSFITSMPLATNPLITPTAMASKPPTTSTPLAANPLITSTPSAAKPITTSTPLAANPLITSPSLPPKALRTSTPPNSAPQTPSSAQIGSVTGLTAPALTATPSPYKSSPRTPSTATPTWSWLSSSRNRPSFPRIISPATQSPSTPRPAQTSRGKTASLLQFTTPPRGIAISNRASGTSSAIATPTPRSLPSPRTPGPSSANATPRSPVLASPLSGAPAASASARHGSSSIPVEAASRQPVAQGVNPGSGQETAGAWQGARDWRRRSHELRAWPTLRKSGARMAGEMVRSRVEIVLVGSARGRARVRMRRPRPDLDGVYVAATELTAQILRQVLCWGGATVEIRREGW